MTAILAAMIQGVQPVTVPATFVYREGTGSQTATLQWDNDGTTKDHFGATLLPWLLSGTAADYDVKAELASGDTPTGSALGTWLNCASDHSWSLTALNAGKTCTLTFSVGYAGTGAAISTGPISITVLSEPS